MIKNLKKEFGFASLHKMDVKKDFHGALICYDNTSREDFAAACQQSVNAINGLSYYDE